MLNTKRSVHIQPKKTVVLMKLFSLLQSRNLDQKRRWCQEIKRLILESYKGKIPEKVKSLVMQLGKSKEEEGEDIMAYF